MAEHKSKLDVAQDVDEFIGIALEDVTKVYAMTRVGDRPFLMYSVVMPIRDLFAMLKLDLTKPREHYWVQEMYNAFKQLPAAYMRPLTFGVKRPPVNQINSTPTYHGISLNYLENSLMPMGDVWEMEWHMGVISFTGNEQLKLMCDYDRFESLVRAAQDAPEILDVMITVQMIAIDDTTEAGKAHEAKIAQMVRF